MVRDYGQGALGMGAPEPEVTETNTSTETEEVAESEEGSGEDQTQVTAPISVLMGKEVSPGDMVQMKVVSMEDGQVTLECDKESESGGY